MDKLAKNTVAAKELSRWYELSNQIAKLRVEEQALRQQIYASAFKEPQEGVNSVALEDGWVLKGKRIISRVVDEAAFRESIEELAKAGVKTDEVVRYKPDLALKEYRSLTEEQRHLMDSCLIIKDGMPGLEIVKPKRG